jgi:hypothetical protein
MSAWPSSESVQKGEKMRIDWAATGAMLQGEGTLLGAAAVVIAAVIGGSTFKSWRRQEVAGRKLAQAERILEATYKARRALSYVRGPMMWGHELKAAEDALKADEQWDRTFEPKQKRMVTTQAYFNRLNKTRDEQAALDACLPMARALFGEELEQAIETLRHQFWVVQVDAESYMDDEGEDRDFTRKIRRGMYDVKPPEGEVNEVTEKIETAVATIEATCLPVLRGLVTSPAGTRAFGK